MELLQKAPDFISGKKTFAGIDEAGRGCLAGPVVAAAVVLPESYSLSGLADSKTLSEKKRNELAAAIKKQAASYGYGVVWPRIIDKINILQATFMAMAKACGKLRPMPELLYIDGNMIIPDFYFKEKFHRSPVSQRAFVKGDALIPAISAASILAKCLRDQLMVKFDKKWPNYGFAVHKGYGTKMHLEALKKFGPCPLHRFTFRNVRSENTLYLKLPDE